MGYYSEVAICMAFEDEAKRDAFYDLMSLRTDDVGDVIRNKCAKDDREPWITYHDSSIKWYESHPTRQAFENDGCLLELCVECGGAWHMLRLGEEADDYETNGDEAKDSPVIAPTDAFYMVRHIEWG